MRLAPSWAHFVVRGSSENETLCGPYIDPSDGVCFVPMNLGRWTDFAVTSALEDHPTLQSDESILKLSMDFWFE
jgi:hypothetical protein